MHDGDGYIAVAFTFVGFMVSVKFAVEVVEVVVVGEGSEEGEGE